MLGFDRATLDPLLDDRDRGTQDRIVEADGVAGTGGREQVEHERVDDPLGDGDVAPGGEGGDRLGGGVQHDPVFRVRLLPPRADRPAPQLGEEPIEIEADREVVAVGHQRRGRRLAASRGAGEQQQWGGVRRCCVFA